MITLQQWLDAYGESHRNPKNVAIHKICIPLILFSILGFLSALPLPLNAAWLLVAAGVLFYARLSLRMALAMLALCLVMLSVLYGLRHAGLDLLSLSAVLFVLAWIGQFAGHRIEGRKPSFFEDLRFLMIGPAWTLASLTQHCRIRW
ncbi:MAG: DUF962 domain-containing protein [Paludibacterium sp.]|uniref:Mpo1 family 2-hydroxy fatty acid dioxygenase n=1 Tax=Paludibacterium sp. TaxID=1917523 RepID=UPI0025DC7B3B|nr:Mpo1-like protein [Paludibacterium sp.]MBV8046297.1 DUF962 domain-containing protein [Paludibacterium sp.]MBV8649101.1 DUF962 domain-containing protein [Paludibacterium sp.]